MKVIHLISGLRGGGAEQLVLQLCQQAKGDTAIKMKVAILSHINDLEESFKEDNVEVIKPKTQKTKGFRTALSTIRQLLKESPDTVHAHLYWAALAAAYIKVVRPKIRIVFT